MGEVLVLNKRSINFHLSMRFKQEHVQKNYIGSDEASRDFRCFSISKHEFKLLKMGV